MVVGVASLVWQGLMRCAHDIPTNLRALHHAGKDCRTLLEPQSADDYERLEERQNRYRQANPIS